MEFILFILKWGLGLFFGLILFFIMCWLAGYAFHKGTEAYYEELINKGKFPARLWEDQKKNSKNN
jgi:TM2 domain-containing membrane protein YozV